MTGRTRETRPRTRRQQVVRWAWVSLAVVGALVVLLVVVAVLLLVLGGGGGSHPTL